MTARTFARLRAAYSARWASRSRDRSKPSQWGSRSTRFASASQASPGSRTSVLARPRSASQSATCRWSGKMPRSISRFRWNSSGSRKAGGPANGSPITGSTISIVRLRVAELRRPLLGREPVRLLGVVVVDHRVPRGPRALEREDVHGPADLGPHLPELDRRQARVVQVQQRAAVGLDDDRRVVVDRGLLGHEEHREAVGDLERLPLGQGGHVSAPGGLELAEEHRRGVLRDHDRQVVGQPGQEPGVDVVEVLVGDHDGGRPLEALGVQEMLVRRVLEPGGLEGPLGREPRVDEHGRPSRLDLQAGVADGGDPHRPEDSVTRITTG